MQTPAPLDVVNAFSRRVATAENVAEIAELVSDDIDWFVVGDAAVVPWAGRRTGKAGIAEFYATLRRETQSEHFHVSAVLTEGNRVLVIGDLATRVKRTGKLIACEFVFDFTVENGLITRFRPFEDSLAIAEAFA